ncbi:hypothetical protein COBT_002621 [Conglomerata obtusa]
MPTLLLLCINFIGFNATINREMITFKGISTQLLELNNVFDIENEMFNRNQAEFIFLSFKHTNEKILETLANLISNILTVFKKNSNSDMYNYCYFLDSYDIFSNPKVNLMAYFENAYNLYRNNKLIVKHEDQNKINFFFTRNHRKYDTQYIRSVLQQGYHLMLFDSISKVKDDFTMMYLLFISIKSLENIYHDRFYYFFVLKDDNELFKTELKNHDVFNNLKNIFKQKHLIDLECVQFNLVNLKESVNSNIHHTLGKCIHFYLSNNTINYKTNEFNINQNKTNVDFEDTIHIKPRIKVLKNVKISDKQRISEIRLENDFLHKIQIKFYLKTITIYFIITKKKTKNIDNSKKDFEIKIASVYLYDNLNYRLHGRFCYISNLNANIISLCSYNKVKQTNFADYNQLFARKFICDLLSICNIDFCKSNFTIPSFNILFKYYEQCIHYMPKNQPYIINASFRNGYDLYCMIKAYLKQNKKQKFTYKLYKTIFTSKTMGFKNETFENYFFNNIKILQELDNKSMFEGILKSYQAITMVLTQKEKNQNVNSYIIIPITKLKLIQRLQFLYKHFSDFLEISYLNSINNGKFNCHYKQTSQIMYKIVLNLPQCAYQKFEEICDIDYILYWNRINLYVLKYLIATNYAHIEFNNNEIDFVSSWLSADFDEASLIRTRFFKQYLIYMKTSVRWKFLLCAVIRALKLFKTDFIKQIEVNNTVSDNCFCYLLCDKNSESEKCFLNLISNLQN